MTYKEKIKFELKTSNGLTCAGIVRWLLASYPEDRKKGRQRLMSTVSSTLHRMVDRDEVYVLPWPNGPRGGNVYKLNEILD